VGGGDGGVLREVARHRCIERIHIAEIDACARASACMAPASSGSSAGVHAWLDPGRPDLGRQPGQAGD